MAQEQIIRTQEEINEVLDKISEIKNTQGTKFHGMVYEEGIEAMWEWLTDEHAENPLEE